MISSLVHIKHQIERIQELIPANEDPKNYLARALDAEISSISSDTPMGVVPLSILSSAKMYASARVAIEIIDKPEELLVKPEGIIDLGVIEWILRPALRLRDGFFGRMVSGPWQDLQPDLVRTVEQSVCRLDLSVRGYEPVHVGTGVLAGEDTRGQLIVLTNSHVVEGALGNGWQSESSVELDCDFSRYSIGDRGKICPVLKEHQIHPYYDLALLRICRDYFQTGVACPKPLTISGSPPDEVIGLRVGVIGHPSFSSDIDPFPKYFGFGNEFGVKRFSPGLIRAFGKRCWRQHDVAVLLHDATTLSGSSGSCILDLASMKVVGLHFGGWPMPRKVVSLGKTTALAELFYENGAVPLWTLKDDPLMAKLEFG